jgi:hypothetical protein
MKPAERPPNQGYDRMKALDIWAPWLLVGIGILFFADTLFTGRNFYFRDILNFHYPLRRVLIDAWARGEFPLWNPYIYFGQPMLANPNYMALYPTNLFHLAFPFNYAFKLHFIIHPLLAGPGLYLLQRRLRIPPVAAFAGAIAYEFSGTLLSFLNLYNILPAVALLPWIGWAFLGALQGKWLRRSLVFGGLLALQIFALEPLMFQCDVLLLAGIAAFHLLQSDDRSRDAIRLAQVGSTGVFFAFGLGAVQIFPTLEMLEHAIRGSGIDYGLASRWSMHPMDFLNTIVPNLFGNPFSIGYATSWGEAYHHGDLGVLVSFFAGSGVLLLTFISFNSSRKQLQRVVVCIALAGIFLALGRFNPIYHWLYDHVPGLNLGRYPSKCFLLAALAVSILAALGIDTLSEQSESRPRRRNILAIGSAGIVLGAILAAAAITWWIRPEPLLQWLRSQVEPQQAAAKVFGEILGQLLRSLLSSGAFLILGGGLILVSGLRNRSIPVSGLWLALLLGELIPANLRLAPMMSGADVDFVPDIDRFVLAKGSREPFRVVAPNWLPPIQNRLRAPNRSLAWVTLFYKMTSQTMGGIPRGVQYSLDGSIDLLNTADSEDLYRRCLLLPEGSRVKLMEKLNSPIVLSIGAISHPDLLPLASFDTRSDYRLYAYWLKDSSPRAYFAPRVFSVPSHQNALDFLLQPDLSLHEAVILEGASPSDDKAPIVPGKARVLEYHSSGVSCETETSVAGYLVLLDSYYPGWRAYVDGREVEIRRANFAFRAVPVPAGRHQIEFVYKPRSFYVGLTITLLSAVFGLLSLLMARGEGAEVRGNQPKSDKNSAMQE